MGLGRGLAAAAHRRRARRAHRSGSGQPGPQRLSVAARAQRLGHHVRRRQALRLPGRLHCDRPGFGPPLLRPHARNPATGKRARFCPSWWGGKNWPPAAYNPKTKLLYIPANENLCAELEGLDDVPYIEGLHYMGDRERPHPARRGRSHRRAPGLESLDRRAGVEARLRVAAVGPAAHDRRQSRLRRRYQRSRVPRLRRARPASCCGSTRPARASPACRSPTSSTANSTSRCRSGWGVDAERGHKNLNGIRGTTTHVPAGGVLWVFALPSP